MMEVGVQQGTTLATHSVEWYRNLVALYWVHWDQHCLQWVVEMLQCFPVLPWRYQGLNLGPSASTAANYHWVTALSLVGKVYSIYSASEQHELCKSRLQALRNVGDITSHKACSMKLLIRMTSAVHPAKSAKRKQCCLCTFTQKRVLVSSPWLTSK